MKKNKDDDANWRRSHRVDIMQSQQKQQNEEKHKVARKVRIMMMVEVEKSYVESCCVYLFFFIFWTPLQAQLRGKKKSKNIWSIKKKIKKILRYFWQNLQRNHTNTWIVKHISFYPKTKNNIKM